jgi:rSAM/selenodomain-associated transferase 2
VIEARQTQPPRAAVVVPALDEEDALRRHLPALFAQLQPGDEVVVSDGGSSDGGPGVARRLGARLVDGPRGRGAQLRRGAEASSAPLLVFLHADSRLPPDGLALARAAVAQGAVGGGFLVRFDSQRRVMRAASALINLRTRLTRCPLGDQAQFATRDAYRALGGYRDWPILEDLDFARRLKRLGRVALIAEPVTTAARRFLDGGVVRTVTINWVIWALYFAGVSPRRLARLYRVRR